MGLGEDAKLAWDEWRGRGVGLSSSSLDNISQVEGVWEELLLMDKDDETVGTSVSYRRLVILPKLNVQPLETVEDVINYATTQRFREDDTEERSREKATTENAVIRNVSTSPLLASAELLTIQAFNKIISST